MEFFKDPEKHFMIPELFSEQASADAKAIRDSGLKSNQFRNYFQELRAIEESYRRKRTPKQETAQQEPSDANWQETLPRLHMLKARVAYGQRRNGPSTPEFQAFMNKVIESGMRSPKDFEAMMLYVEAVLAYFYAEENSGYDSRRR
jgi:CRISPR-associated protein Csm2